jgi:hypothetical protein
MHHHGHKVFSEMEQVCSPAKEAYDVVSKSTQPVDSADVWISAIECDALSGANMNRQIGKGVIASGTSGTGRTAQFNFQYTVIHRPKAVLMECDSQFVCPNLHNA